MKGQRLGRSVTQKMLDAIDAYRDTNKPILEICAEYGVSSGGIGKHIKRLGINRNVYPKRTVPSQWIGVTGSAHPVFKTGLSVNAYGYIIRRAPDHPFPRVGFMILEHVRVMELIIGRRIARNEDVHHKDLDRQNNDPENLELMNYHAHQHMHRVREWAIRRTAAEAAGVRLGPNVGKQA